MNNVINREINPWIRPWDTEKFDDLYNRDERFFSILVKGVISWLNKNIVMYGKPINHFIFNTGSSVMFIETNGYEYNWKETTGEDQAYMHLPRCVLELGGLSVPSEELTSPYARGDYERRDGNFLQGFNAEIRRLPVELTISLHYVLSNFNESIILIQELLDKIVFQKYFSITYLGQVIKCSIEFPGDTQIEFNKIDLASPDDRNKHIDLEIRVCTNYPVINERSEIPTDKIISGFQGSVKIGKHIDDKKYTELITDTHEYKITSDE